VSFDDLVEIFSLLQLSNKLIPRTLHDLEGRVVGQLMYEVDHFGGEQVGEVKDRLQFRQRSLHHLVHAGLSGPDAGQDPLHPLRPPEGVEQHQVLPSTLREDRTDGTL